MPSFLRQHHRSILLFLTLAAALWLVFGPVQMGGPTGYVIISGNSMEPEIKLGDLVITRRAESYQVGQAVVYQHPQIGFVFHRIVDRHGEAFILQGDNNNWLDTYQPLAAEILGRYWLRIPGAGGLIRKLREPAYFTGFAVIIIIILGSLVLFRDQERLKKKIRGKFTAMNKNQALSSGDTRQEVLLFIGLLGLTALIFSLIAYNKPTTKIINDDLTYFQQGDFSYTAQDSENLYDTEQIQTGEPIYLNLTCDMDLTFGYQLVFPGNGAISLNQLQGTYAVDAVLRDVDGWKRSFNLIPETEFEGSKMETAMAFDICQAQSLILDKEEKTETANRWYDLVISPRVTISGAVNTHEFEETYQPVIVFQLDSLMLRLPDGIEGLDLNQEGSIENQRVISNTMSIFGREITVILARRIGLFTLLFCLLAAVLPVWSLYRDWRASSASRIQVQYHPLLIDVEDGNPADHADQVVQVASFSDLTKMAERYGAMILHESRGSFHRYSVQDEHVVYQYSLDVFAAQSLFPDRIEFKRAIKKGIKENQFELYYQPVVGIDDCQVVGLEAFLRWEHPEHGTLYPVDFITQAEQAGLIPELDSWVIRRVCRQIAKWQDLGLQVVPVSINISPETIGNEEFIGKFTALLRESFCHPDLLQIEINRSNLVLRNKEIRKHLELLAESGIKLALDNFGTNDANQINQVLAAQIKVLKIDRSVVKEMNSNPQAERLIRAVAAMAKSSQMNVIAQGVESADDLDTLIEQGIEIAQGYYLGKPVLPQDLVDLLENGQGIIRNRRSGLE